MYQFFSLLAELMSNEVVHKSIIILQVLQKKKKKKKKKGRKPLSHLLS